MRILFVNEFCGLFGGTEQLLSDMVPAFVGRGHVCDLAFARRGRESDAFASLFRLATNCRNLGTPPDSSNSEDFSAILERSRPDTIFFHNVQQLPSLTGLPPTCRTFRMVHDVSLVCPTGLGYYRHGKCSCNHPAGWRCWLDLAFLARNDEGGLPVKTASIRDKLAEMHRNMTLNGIITVSQYMEQRLRRNGFQGERIRVVPPVLRTDNEAPTPVPESPEILYVGSLLRGKGLDLLFDSLRRLKCPWHLRIVGDGKSRATLEQLCQRLGLGDKTEFCGWIPHDTLHGYYTQARVVVVPTRAPESFCLIGPEAMCHGRPVVAFDVGGISSWLDHELTGILVPEQDVVRFSRALDRVLRDREYAQQLGTNAARRMRERFTFERYLDTLESILYGTGLGPRDDESGT